MAEVKEFKAGTFCWVELGTSNQDGAKRFYTELFGWSLADVPMGPGMGFYTMLKLRNQDAAALYQLSKDQLSQGVPPHWMSYVSVANVDESAKKAASLGGKLMMAPFDVMDVGRMALVQDPSGATFSLWQARKHKGASIVGEPGAFCWNELITGNVAAAGSFYKALFSWGSNEMPMPNMTYTIFMNGDKQAAGMMPILPEMGKVPPHWMVYFAVDDCDGRADRAKRLGAKIFVPPTDIPTVGRFATLSDPQGAAFSIIKLQTPA